MYIFTVAARRGVLCLLSQVGAYGSVQAIMSTEVEELLQRMFVKQENTDLQLANLKALINDFLHDMIQLWNSGYPICHKFLTSLFKYIVFRRRQLAT